MAEERPGDRLEERMVFHVGGSSAGAEPSHLIFYEQLAYNRFAKAGKKSLAKFNRWGFANTHFETCGEFG